MRLLARRLQQPTTKMAAALYTNQVKNRGRVYLTRRGDWNMDCGWN